MSTTLILSLSKNIGHHEDSNVNGFMISTNNNAMFTSASLRSAARSIRGHGVTRNKDDTMMERWVSQVQKDKAAEGDDPLLRDVRAILNRGSIDELRSLQTHMASTAWMYTRDN